MKILVFGQSLVEGGHRWQYFLLLLLQIVPKCSYIFGDFSWNLLKIILSQENDLILGVNEGSRLGLLLGIPRFLPLDLRIHSRRFVGFDIFPEHNALGIEGSTNHVQSFHKVMDL